MKHNMSRPDYDALVIGAGITGMYQVYLLAGQGLSVIGVESAPEVGGTWYWNRYPGCRLDTESYAYGYFALNGILLNWSWSERFAGAAEMRRYVNEAADAMDIRKYFRFDTRVTSAHFDDDTGLWNVTLNDVNRVICRHLI